MSDIEALDDWLQPLINRLSISQKKQLTKKLALEMRRRSVKKIKAQQNPDGSSFVPRKSNRPPPRNPPIRFLYKKPNGISRIIYMRSWQNQGIRMTGFDREANGMRTVLKSRIEHYLPTPNGSGEPLRQKKGHIKQKMFQRISKPKFFLIDNDTNSAAIGFNGGAANISGVHQLGLTDKVNAAGLEYNYPKRELLGFEPTDKVWITDMIMDFLDHD